MSATPDSAERSQNGKSCTIHKGIKRQSIHLVLMTANRVQVWTVTAERFKERIQR